MSDKSEGRLRERPSARFASPERKLDFDQSFEELLAEPQEATDGHRQITLARHGAFTLILFHFDEGGQLPDHVVDGEVTIQVLAGEIEVTTPDERHRLAEDQMLILAPDIEHDVLALSEARMLLTVHLDHERAEK